jgi:senataxin
VCAPSNAAVDELVMRFKNGIKTLNGEERKVNIVRLGRSDAINVNVQDVTLDQLVNQKLGQDTKDTSAQEANRKLFQDHKAISDQLKLMRDEENKEMIGDAAVKFQDNLNYLRQQKKALGVKIDNLKDDQNRSSRNGDLDRRRAREAVLNNAQIICATLSASGHEMFQKMSI